MTWKGAYRIGLAEEARWNRLRRAHAYQLKCQRSKLTSGEVIGDQKTVQTKMENVGSRRDVVLRLVNIAGKQGEWRSHSSHDEYWGEVDRVIYRATKVAGNMPKETLLSPAVRPKLMVHSDFVEYLTPKLPLFYTKLPVLTDDIFRLSEVSCFQVVWLFDTERDDMYDP